MTPELKTACELVFQEHKIAIQPIKWHRDAFRGKISLGLSEMAKETLVKKNIIVNPDKTKKVFTQLNPDVASAGSFEEAEQIIVNKIPALATADRYDAKTYIAQHVMGLAGPKIIASKPEKKTEQTEIPVPLVAVKPSSGMKWYMKPVFLYLVWPVFGALAGIVISRIMDVASAELFLRLK